MEPTADRAAVSDEIGLLIVEALREGDVIKADNIANFIAAGYPLSSLSIGEISARIIEAAFVAGMDVEIRSSKNDERAIRLTLPDYSREVSRLLG